MRAVKILLDALLYGNVLIALGAVALAGQTLWLLSGRWSCTPYMGFLFFATLFLYTLHRLIGLAKSAKTTFRHDRWKATAYLKPFLYIELVLSAIVSFFFFIKIAAMWTWLLLPCALAAAYVLPLFGGARRLRDVHFVKIFLLTAVWTSLTVLLPAAELHLTTSLPMLVMIIERMCFIFAIALAFDLRDIESDKLAGVRTLPGSWGLTKTKIIAVVSLIFMLIAAFFNWRADAYHVYSLLALTMSAFCSAICIAGAYPGRSDYYFSGLIDGMLLLQSILILLW